MMAFPGMLIDAGNRAGMKVSDDPDNFDPNEFPHFQVFCAVQLGHRMQVGEHFDNAKVIANIPEDEIRLVSLGDLINRGLSWAT